MRFSGRHLTPESGRTHDTLVIDLSDALLVGTTTALTLLDVIEDEKLKGRRVLLAGIHQPEVKRSFQQLGIFDLVQEADRIENTGALIEKSGSERV